jgi:hypothetical protein
MNAFGGPPLSGYLRYSCISKSGYILSSVSSGLHLLICIFSYYQQLAAFMVFGLFLAFSFKKDKTYPISFPQYTTGGADASFGETSLRGYFR